MSKLTCIKILSGPKFTANLYCICFSIDLRYTKKDAVQICGKFWDEGIKKKLIQERKNIANKGTLIEAHFIFHVSNNGFYFN